MGAFTPTSVEISFVSKRGHSTTLRSSFGIAMCTPSLLGNGADRSPWNLPRRDAAWDKRH
jgi:hypothetical protein